MATFPKRRKRPGQGPRVGGPFAQAPAAAATGHVVVVFGGPKSGVSQALQVLHEESRTQTVLLDGRDEDWMDHAEAAVAQGAIVLVDAAKPDAQALYDRGLVIPGSGALVRMWTSKEEAQRRAGEEDVSEAVDAFVQEVKDLDRHTQILGMPFFMIPNERYWLDAAIGELARRAGIRN